ncbi:UNVERIFIED_ORG: hypothetical protein J2740_000949 [Rhizobium nepotum]|nr:hypothetical protein [Rhizobium nepotum]
MIPRKELYAAIDGLVETEAAIQLAMEALEDYSTHSPDRDMSKKLDRIRLVLTGACKRVDEATVFIDRVQSNSFGEYLEKN